MYVYSALATLDPVSPSPSRPSPSRNVRAARPSSRTLGYLHELSGCLREAHPEGRPNGKAASAIDACQRGN